MRVAIEVAASLRDNTEYLVQFAKMMEVLAIPQVGSSFIPKAEEHVDLPCIWVEEIAFWETASGETGIVVECKNKADEWLPATQDWIASGWKQCDGHELLFGY